MIEMVCEKLGLDEKDLLIENLQQRIDKAIEYIKESEEEYGYLEDCEKTILEILEGGNDE